jgi:ureidoglycolate lyase
MKLLRYGLLGQERPGLLDSDGRIRDLSRDVADIGPDCLTSTGLVGIAKLDPRSLPLVDGRPAWACRWRGSASSSPSV